MATNLVQHDPSHIVAACSHPAAPNSGDPVRIGSLVGVALTDEGDGGNAATETTVDIGKRIYRINVDDNEATGIAIGDKLYYHDTGTGSPTTSVNNSATAADAFFGVALGAITANGTAEIDVLVCPMGN